jgi:hypothetical protein
VGNATFYYDAKKIIDNQLKIKKTLGGVSVATGRESFFE